MEKILVAQRVANQLFATEKSVDKALKDAMQLMSEMIQASEQLGVSPVAGAAPADEIAQAINALTTARAAVLRGHGQLAETKLRLGIRTTLTGVVPKSFDDPARAPRLGGVKGEVVELTETARANHGS